MAGLVFVFAMLGSMILLMSVAYGRMISIRDSQRSRVESTDDSLPVITPYVDEIRNEGGLTLARIDSFDPALSAADKRAAEMPDVEQTIQGRR
ncbi:MAG: hypothetical protein KGL44_12510 [Sphingomonadales bacterium]|nr:hypothetical protein [Sphingomonadales bacterium]